MASAPYAGKRWYYTRRLVLERDGYRCQIQLPGCTIRARAVDHIREVSDGGDWYALSNLQASCTPCNTRKENMRRLHNHQLVYNPVHNQWRTRTTPRTRAQRRRTA